MVSNANSSGCSCLKSILTFVCGIFTGGFSDRSFKFNVTIIKKKKVLRFAELQLYKLPSTPDTYPDSTATIHIEDIYSGKLVSSQLVSLETTDWISFSIPLDIIRRWSRNAESNAGLAVHINGSKEAPAIRFATRQTDPSLQLLLLLHCSDTENRFPEVLNVSFQATLQQRNPRSVHASNTGPCQRRDHIIHFKDLGWDDWVIAPTMYSAYRCEGACQIHDANKMKTNHARLKLFLSQEDSDLADAPCCVPDHLGSISMLYHGGPGESPYVLKQMNDFVVKSCACL